MPDQIILEIVIGEEATMISMREVEAQLKNAGIRVGFWGRPEIRELQHIMLPSENIIGVVNGRYEGGFATIVTTDQRLMLIDKKPLYLTVEDIRYDMISEVDFNARLMNASVCILTVNKKLNFKSYHHKNLRAVTSYIQQRVMELRQMYQQIQQQGTASPALPRVQFNPRQVGATAMGAPMVNVNPYTKLPLMIRRRGYTIPYRG